MNKKHLTIATVVVALALVAAPFALAQRMHRGDHAMRGGPGEMGGMAFLGHLQHAQKALGLSDQQVTDIKTIVKDLRTQNQAFRQAQHETMKQIATILLNDPNNVSAAQALIDKQSDTERQMKSNALLAASKALNVLTPEQRGKLQTFINEHHQRMMQK